MAGKITADFSRAVCEAFLKVVEKYKLPEGSMAFFSEEMKKSLEVIRKEKDESTSTDR